MKYSRINFLNVCYGMATLVTCFTTLMIIICNIISCNISSLIRAYINNTTNYQAVHARHYHNCTGLKYNMTSLTGRRERLPVNVFFDFLLVFRCCQLLCTLYIHTQNVCHPSTTSARASYPLYRKRKPLYVYI